MRAYPELDVRAELLKCHAWLTSNPKRAVGRDMARTIYNWLSNAERFHEPERKVASEKDERGSLKQQILRLAKWLMPYGELLTNGYREFDWQDAAGSHWGLLEGQEHLRCRTPGGTYPWDRVSLGEMRLIVETLTAMRTKIQEDHDGCNREAEGAGQGLFGGGQGATGLGATHRGDCGSQASGSAPWVEEQGSAGAWSPQEGGSQCF
jgi:hypothetical protein